MPSEQNYTPEEQAQIDKILEPLSAHTDHGYFSPMEEHYQADLSDIKAKADSALEDLSASNTPDTPEVTEDLLKDMGSLDSLDSFDTSENLEEGGITEDSTAQPRGFDLGTPEKDIKTESADDALVDTQGIDGPGDLGSLGDLGGELDTEIMPSAPTDTEASESFALPEDREKETVPEKTSGDGELFDLGDLTTPEQGPDGLGMEDTLPPLSTEEDSALGTPALPDPPALGDEFVPSVEESSVGADDDLSSDLSESDIADLGDQAQAEMGIGEEFTDQELANIRSALMGYPPQIRKAVIDAVVNEKIEPSEQRLLMNILIENAPPEKLADFIEAHLNYRPSVESARYTKEGLEIIYADELSPEAIARRRRRNRIVLSSSALAFLVLVGTFGALTFYRWVYVKDLYEMGLSELSKAQYSFSPADRKEHRRKAENYFQKALRKDGNRYDPEYLNRYGLAYMKARFYDEAYTKLFGRSKPPYGSFQKRTQAPLVRKVKGAVWRQPLGKGTRFTDQSGIVRTVESAGAYMLDRLREKKMQPLTLSSLGRFHSNIARDFADRKTAPSYKNDALAIDYYRLILTLLNQPRNTMALAGIGDIFYNQKHFLKAAGQYRKIIDHEPLNIVGNAGLLNTYIELAKKTNDPRAALAKHRELRRSGLEEELPIYLTAKLAGFYGELDAQDVFIKYQIDPVDKLDNQDLKDNARHLLELAFEKTELRDDEKIVGSRYAEGFYQRGLFLLRQKENRRALRQFQKAHHYDPLHYLAVNQMGNYYKNIRDFQRSAQYYAEAIEIYKRFIPFGGRRPEDETLLEGDIAQVYYNAGALLFLRYAGFANRKDLGFPNTRLYPFRAQKIDNPEIRQRRQKLAQAKEYFQQAQVLQLRDPQSLAHLRYWSGWIDYMNADFSSAIEQWEAMDSVRQSRDPALLIGKANSYYYTDQLRNSLGHYLKLKSDLEKDSYFIKIQSGLALNEKERQMLLIAIYNNIGAIYERETQELAKNIGNRKNKNFRELEKEALLYYWKAIELARQAKLDNEISRTNVQLAFKANSQEREPLIDDWLLPVLSSLKYKF